MRKRYNKYMKNTLRSIWANKVFRILAPLLLIGIWFGIGGVGGPTFGKIADVSTNDQASFLPASAESTKVQQVQKDFYSSDSIPAIVILESPSIIQPAQLANLSSLTATLKTIDGVTQTSSAVVGPIPSDDQKAVEYIVSIDKNAELKSVVAEMRQALDKNVAIDFTYYVTGPAGIAADLVSAFGGIDGILLIVALAAVFIILLIVYRSILLPFIVLLTSVFALCGAILLIYLLALKGIITLNGQSQGILSILVIGAATDYSLLLIARYKEALHKVESKWEAIGQAYKGAFEPIAASAATVVVALLCLLFSDLNSNKSLGPIAATGIVLAFISAMTFLPAMLVALGRAAFWPLIPHVEETSPMQISNKKRGVWERIAGSIERHPRRMWMVSAVILLLCASGVLQLRASGTSQTATILGTSNAVDGQAAIGRHFSAGSGSPAVVIVASDQASELTKQITTLSGVSKVDAYTGGAPFASVPPKVVAGKQLLNVTLANAADSIEAENTIVAMRSLIANKGTDAVVGGESAIMLDTNDTAKQDLYKIVPIVLVVILIILMLLLRSVLSAVILIGSVILSYFATLGVAAVVFNHLLGFPGADPSVPLFGFIFLVALGVDYNIFLMTRVREEAKQSTTRKAILHALQVTGGVITSAGVVLAATFAALGVIPILFLVQLAFIVSFGVLLDAIIVRSLLLPALTYDIGSKIWWPSPRSRKP